MITSASCGTTSQAIFSTTSRDACEMASRSAASPPSACAVAGGVAGGRRRTAARWARAAAPSSAAAAAGPRRRRSRHRSSRRRRWPGRPSRTAPGAAGGPGPGPGAGAKGRGGAAAPRAAGGGGGGRIPAPFTLVGGSVPGRTAPARSGCPGGGSGGGTVRRGGPAGCRRATGVGACDGAGVCAGGARCGREGVSGRRGHARVRERQRLGRHPLDELAHAGEQRLAVEGLGDVAIGARGTGPRLVERLEGSGEQEHRHLAELRVGLQRLAELVAVHAGHDRVGEHDVGPGLPRPGERVLAVVHGGDPVVLPGEDDAHDLLDGDRVVGEQQVLGHCFLGRVLPES